MQNVQAALRLLRSLISELKTVPSVPSVAESFLFGLKTENGIGVVIRSGPGWIKMSWHR